MRGQQVSRCRARPGQNTKDVVGVLLSSPSELLLIRADLLSSVEEVPVVEFMYLAFTRTPGESDRRRLRSFLSCLCDIFRALIISLVC